MVEKGIRGGICHSIYRYAKANNKYMKDYEENKKWSSIQYCDLNNLYGWAMSQKLPVTLPKKPSFLFPNVMKRWSFQKTCTGIWPVLYY